MPLIVSQHTAPAPFTHFSLSSKEEVQLKCTKGRCMLCSPDDNLLPYHRICLPPRPRGASAQEEVADLTLTFLCVAVTARGNQVISAVASSASFRDNVVQSQVLTGSRLAAVLAKIALLRLDAEVSVAFARGRWHPDEGLVV